MQTNADANNAEKTTERTTYIAAIEFDREVKEMVDCQTGKCSTDLMDRIGAILTKFSQCPDIAAIQCVLFSAAANQFDRWSALDDEQLEDELLAALDGSPIAAKMAGMPIVNMKYTFPKDGPVQIERTENVV